MYRGSFILFFILVPVFFVKSKHGGIYEGVQGSAFFLCRATGASGSVYESADAAHLQELILLRVGYVFIDTIQHLGAYALLYAVENLERVGDRGFLYAHHIATLDDEYAGSEYPFFQLYEPVSDGAAAHAAHYAEGAEHSGGQIRRVPAGLHIPESAA